jgi:hypothetical protein
VGCRRLRVLDGAAGISIGMCVVGKQLLHGQLLAGPSLP